MILITLRGEPISTGSIYRSHCRGSFPITYMTAKSKTLKEDYSWQAKQQYKGKPLEGDLKIIIRLYFGTKRKSDWDNFHKLSMDSLISILWKDDSQIIEAVVNKKYDKASPRIEIEIYE